MTNVAEQRLRLPPAGASREELRREMDEASVDDAKWLERLAAGTNYAAGDDVVEVAKEAYLRYFSTNGLLPSTFPSLAKFEREVVDYAAGLLHGPDAVGSITSGGSESILMGVKSARDRARVVHPEIRAPRMVVPESAHPAFWKAAHYFGLELVRTPLDADLQIDVDAYRAAIDDSTVLLVASAPSLTLGMVDPIEELAPLAAGAGHQLPRRFVRRWLLPAVRREARVSGPDASISGSRA